MVDTNKGIVLAGPGRRAIVCGRLVRRAWTSYRWDDRPRPPTLSPTRTGPVAWGSDQIPTLWSAPGRLRPGTARDQGLRHSCTTHDQGLRM